MVCAARLTQSGHKIKSLADFMELYEKPYNEKTVILLQAVNRSIGLGFFGVLVALAGQQELTAGKLVRYDLIKRAPGLGAPKMASSKYGRMESFIILHPSTTPGLFGNMILQGPLRCIGSTKEA